MLRGYRLYVLALGLILAGAQQPSKSTQGAGGTYQAQVSPGASAAPTETTQPPYRPYPDYNPDPCYQAKNHDSADLCAQWRAAIAAEKAAHESRRATNWGIAATFLSFATLFGLIVTILQTQGALGEARKGNRIAQRSNARATRHATHNLEETREATRAMKEANDITRTEKRAWVSIEVELTEFSIKENFVRLCYIARFKNIGNTIATGLYAKATVRFYGKDYVNPVQDFFDISVNATDRTMIDLMPGESVEHWGVAERAYSDLPWFGEDESERVQLVASAAAYYRIVGDTDSSPPRVTERTFTLAKQNINPAKQLVVTKGTIHSLAPDNVVTRSSIPRRTT